MWISSIGYCQVSGASLCLLHACQQGHTVIAIVRMYYAYGTFGLYDVVRFTLQNSTLDSPFVGYAKSPMSLTIDIWLKFVVIEGGIEMVKRD